MLGCRLSWLYHIGILLINPEPPQYIYIESEIVNVLCTQGRFLSESKITFVSFLKDNLFFPYVFCLVFR
jgi:hypothetical protein